MVEPDNLLSRRQPTAAARPPQIPSLTERTLLPARSLFVSRPKPPSRWVGRLALRGKSGVTAAEHSVHRVWRRDQSPPHPRRNACGRFELGYDRCTPRCCLTDFVRDRPSPPSWRLVNLITGRASRSSWRRIFRAGWPRVRPISIENSRRPTPNCSSGARCANTRGYSPASAAFSASTANSRPARQRRLHQHDVELLLVVLRLDLQ